tara:strand:+ start:135 stop:449 length:315 start_codon:yes stop_codon:yes gene_type:complete
MDIKNRDPLIVEVETADGTIRNVLLTQEIDIKHFFGLDDDIAYFFGSDEATEPNDLIGLPLFGDDIYFKCKGIGSADDKTNIITKVKRVFDYHTQKEIANYLRI